MFATSSQYAVLIHPPAIFNSQHTNIAITECMNNYTHKE